MTRDAFFQWAEARQGRFERIEGRVVQLSPERVEHVALKSQIWLALYQALRGRTGYHAYGDGMTVSVGEGTDYEPDVSVNAGPRLAKGVRTLSNPLIVVEVLSPSSQRMDTRIKVNGYFAVPSVAHYLVFRTDRQEVAHWRRNRAVPDEITKDEITLDEITGGRIALEPPGIVLDIDSIYALADEQ